MKRFKMVALAVAMALPMVAEAGQLVVTGQATVEATPDMATITLGVEKQSRTAEAALAENNAAMSALLVVLKVAGIDPRDVQTRGLMLDPQYIRMSNNSPSQVTGYIARNQVRVRVRDLDSLGAVLDAGIKAGGNQFYGLSFDVQDKGPLSDQALANAVRNAAAQAAIMAEAAGVTLGPITDLRQGGGSSQPMPMIREMAMASDAVPVSEGSVGISATVTVTYEITEP